MPAKKGRWGKKNTATDVDTEGGNLKDQNDGGLSLVENTTSGRNEAQAHLEQGIRTAMSANHYHGLINDTTTSGPSSDLEAFRNLFCQNDEHTFCLKECLCKQDDTTLFRKLYDNTSRGTTSSNNYEPTTGELASHFRQAYMTKSGYKLVRPAIILSDVILQNPEYATLTGIIRQLVVRFQISDPIRGLINLYRDGNDSTGFHKDQYHRDMNFTCGASLGGMRRIEFITEVSANNGGTTTNGGNSNSFSFPQYNGDVFAFSNYVNSKFRHGVPKEQHTTGPRISIVVWGLRDLRQKWSYAEAHQKNPSGFVINVVDSQTLTYEKPQLVDEEYY